MFGETLEIVTSEDAMRLRGDESTEFEMTVAGYQFPHLKHEPYDAD